MKSIQFKHNISCHLILYIIKFKKTQPELQHNPLQQHKQTLSLANLANVKRVVFDHLSTPTYRSTPCQTLQVKLSANDDDYSKANYIVRTLSPPNTPIPDVYRAYANGRIGNVLRIRQILNHQLHRMLITHRLMLCIRRLLLKKINYFYCKQCPSVRKYII